MPDFSTHPLNKKYDLDTALSTIWEFYKKWFLSLFTISFVFSLILTYISGRVDVSELYSTNDPAAVMSAFKSMLGPYALILLFTFVFTLVLQYYIIRKPVDPDSNILSIASEGLVRFFIPMLLLSLALGIFAVVAVVLGIFLLFVGALFAIIYVFMLTAFLYPVLMIEENNMSDTITNTLKIAHRNFWQNIGWVTVMGILVVVISFILGAIIMIPFGGSFIKTITNPENAGEIMNLANKPSYIILSALANAVTMPLFPIFSLVLYFNARSSSYKISGKDNDDNNGDKVKIEDLYAPGTKKKSDLKKNTDSSAPSVEDLTP
ncbi:MAG: hypothetical protein K9J25_12645 [Bacteroidales bacterium]|nr:hypothetical protein [Bacteroidales bacterium]